MTGKTALLLVNTGSPDEATPSAVASYLKEFLSDRHIVDLPPVLWQPILNGIVIPRRKAVSASRYASIWTKEGSPLVATTRKTVSRLQNRLGDAFLVSWAMCYGKPRIGDVLEAIFEKSPSQILLMPLFAQEAKQTRGAIVDALNFAAAKKKSHVPMRVVAPWYAHPLYVAALAASVQGAGVDASCTRLVASFHGVPLKGGILYREQCEETVRLLEKALGLKSGAVRIAFQSKFGFGAWLEPSLESVLREEARQRNRSVAVLCPGFAADCLETLEEVEGSFKRVFLSAGGQDFQYIPALNESSGAIALYAQVAKESAAQLKIPVSEPI